MRVLPMVIERETKIQIGHLHNSSGKLGERLEDWSMITIHHGLVKLPLILLTDMN